MPPPNNPHTARVALNVLRDTRHFQNTFHVARTDDAVLNVADLGNINAAVKAWFDALYRTAFKATIVGQNVISTKQDPSDPQQASLNITTVGNYGTGTDEPADVTAAVSWRTGLAGRKFRGRFYDFEVPSDAHTTADVMTGSYISTLASVAQGLLAQLASAGFKLVIFHKADNTYTAVIGFIVDQLLDSMRKRLAGRGT
jgi:hypothetical protein